MQYMNKLQRRPFDWYQDIHRDKKKETLKKVIALIVFGAVLSALVAIYIIHHIQ